MDPVDDCSPDCEELELLPAVELEVEEDAAVDELVDFVAAGAVPAIVFAPITPNRPTAPRAASAAPAVSWLIRRSARSRAEIRRWRFSVLVGMSPSFRGALKRLWEFPGSLLGEAKNRHIDKETTEKTAGT